VLGAKLEQRMELSFFFSLKKTFLLSTMHGFVTWIVSPELEFCLHQHIASELALP